MSYGNAPTTLRLDTHASTLITGKNGAGKSSLIVDGLCFALFGKPYRNIPKGILVNSINQKNCLVEVTFAIGDIMYRVVRGMKPNKFEIYADDTLIDQEAAVRDYQAYLESSILKLNFKTFIQILILSSAAFVPFMKLTAGARREVVEDVLDIGVFSTMNKKLKERISVTKASIAELDAKILANQSDAKATKRIIELMTASKNDKLKEIEADILRIDSTIDQLKQDRAEIQNEMSLLETNKPEEVDTKRLTLLKDDVAFKKRSLKDFDDQVKRISNLDSCPTCRQEVHAEHKTSIKDALAVRIETTVPEVMQMVGVITELEARLSLSVDHTNKVRDTQQRIDRLTSRIDDLQMQIRDLRNKENTASVETGSIEDEQAKLSVIVETALAQIAKKVEYTNEKSLQEVSLSLLKDTGIKAAIVKEYLPALNSAINKYLTEFDFFVNFELDETFTETIKSRGRDDFNYESFSEGEKRRIDVAILLAFRQIAAMKNSAKINILVCDEVDGGLDPDSLECYVKLMTEGIGRNTWIVSHVLSNNPLRDMFHSFLKVKKVGDFTTISRDEDFTAP